jgi:hypothetical protein
MREVREIGEMRKIGKVRRMEKQYFCGRSLLAV